MDGNQSYFVHEDDWAMIEIIPEVNVPQVTTTMQTDETDGNLHLDDRPVIRCPIAMHGLSLDILESLFSGALTHTDDLQTGRTTDMHPVDNGFAFHHDTVGAIYGTHHEGMVCSLYMDNRLCDCDADFKPIIKGLHKLGRKFNLVLADWWLDTLVELKDKQRVITYVEEE